MKPEKLLIGLGLALLLSVFAVFAPVVNAKSLNKGIPAVVQDQIDDLLKAYDAALQIELQQGTTVIVNDGDQGPHKMLSGESQQKMDALWKVTVQKMEDLSARPVAERQKTAEKIQSIEPGTVTYLNHGHTPYDLGAQVERYQVGQRIYSIDTATDTVILIRRVDDLQVNTEPRFTRKELESQARAFIAKLDGGFNLDKLTPSFGDKESTYFFFRWEDTSRRLMDNTIPFVQVGFSRGGDFLNYYNSLSLTTVDAKLNPTASPFLAAWNHLTTANIVKAFSEVYANGGIYWQWEKQEASYSTQLNAGYCYYAGWCSPKNFYSAPATSNGTFYSAPLRGRWLVNVNGNSDASFFIPSTHATAHPCYGIWYNSGYSSIGANCILQSQYFNTWVELPGEPWYNISKLAVPNLTDGLNKEMAWDEAWVYDHN